MVIQFLKNIDQAGCFFDHNTNTYMEPQYIILLEDFTLKIEEIFANAEEMAKLQIFTKRENRMMFKTLTISLEFLQLISLCVHLQGIGGMCDEKILRTNHRHFVSYKKITYTGSARDKHNTTFKDGEVASQRLDKRPSIFWTICPRHIMTAKTL